MRLTHRLVGTRWNTLRHFGAARVPLHLLFTSLEKASFRPPPELNLSGAILPRLGRNFPYRSISRVAWETKIRRYFKPLPVSVDRSIDPVSAEWAISSIAEWIWLLALVSKGVEMGLSDRFRVLTLPRFWGWEWIIRKWVFVERERRFRRDFIFFGFFDRTLLVRLFDSKFCYCMNWFVIVVGTKWVILFQND